MSEIVFSGGQRVVVPSVDANAVMEMLVVQGPPEQVRSGGTVRSGFVPFESDQGIIYVRPDQVAYVCNMAELPETEPADGSIQMPRGRIVPGHPSPSADVALALHHAAASPSHWSVRVIPALRLSIRSSI